MLTQERKNILKGILEVDVKRAETLSTLEPSEVLVKINSLGHDFTLDEVKEYGEILKASKDTLNFEVLENVAGGAGEGYAEEEMGVVCANLNVLCNCSWTW